ncbi:MAG: hypothetical protein GY820_04705, partial [Gammaproteobacteria bacterium]|nr:hypothetical protein [Gammaproteobacteria bacterium]
LTTMETITEVEGEAGTIRGSTIRGKIGIITQVIIRIRTGETILVRINGGTHPIREVIKEIGGRIIINGEIGMNNPIWGIKGINCKISLRGIGMLMQGTQIIDHQHSKIRDQQVIIMLHHRECEL